MGLIAREIERVGIPTLCMSSAWDITWAVRPPRSVFLNFPLNHETGKANDLGLQRQILLDALRAFEMLWAPGQILSLPYIWDAGDRGWEDKDYGPDFVGYGVGQSVQEGYAERRLVRASPLPDPADVSGQPGSGQTSSAG